MKLTTGCGQFPGPVRSPVATTTAQRGKSTRTTLLATRLSRQSAPQQTNHITEHMFEIRCGLLPRSRHRATMDRLDQSGENATAGVTRREATLVQTCQTCGALVGDNQSINSGTRTCRAPPLHPWLRAGGPRRSTTMSHDG